MFSRVILRCLVLSIILSQANDCQAAISSEGDVELNGDLRVGQQEDGSLTVTPPDTLLVSEVFIATDSDVTGIVTIDGASLFAEGFNFIVGEQGNGTLNIKNGGRVSSPDSNNVELLIGDASSAIGRVQVQGEGSLLDFPEGSFLVGGGGFGDLSIEDGGRANSRSAIVGGSPSGNGFGQGSATVSGDGSDWTLRQVLFVGSNGSGELRIEDGGLVRSSTVFSDTAVFGGGFNSGSTGTVSVKGTGSRLLLQGGVIVGGRGSASLAITEGGFVSSGYSRIADGRSFDFLGSGIVSVDGPGSQWQVAGMVLGETGTGQIILTNGAKLVNNSRFSVANSVTVFGGRQDSAGRLLVDGLTTQWLDDAKTVVIGDRGFGELVIQNGAAVINDFVSLGRQRDGRGDVRIDGPNSQWTVRRLEIGLEGSGKIEVANGARLRLIPSQAGLEIGDFGELVLNHGTVLGGSLGSELQNSGILRGSGEILAGVKNFQGSILVGSGDRLLLSQSLLNFDGGRVDILGGELDVRNSFLNSSDGVVTLEDATLRFTPTPQQGSGVLDNAGDIIVAAGQNRIFADIFNSQGRIVLSGNSQTAFHGFIANLASISVSSGSTATFFGHFDGNGIEGGGSVFLEGQISPGFSPGVMEFGGDVTLGSSSQLAIEIANEAHDMLDIAGNATLGGDLVLSALAALDGDTTLEILSAASVLGTFDNVPTMGSDLGFGVLFGGVTYEDDSVVVSLRQQSADFNADGSIDGLDLGIFSAGFGTTNGAELSDGDADRDGDVDGGDFLSWQRDALASASPIASGQTVPEPACTTLIMLAAMLTFAKRRP